MSRFRVVVPVLVCSFSLIFLPATAQQAPSPAVSASELLQQSVSSLGQLPVDSTALGSISITAGSDTQWGSIQIQTRGTDQSSEQLTTSNGTIESTFSHGNSATANNYSKKSLSSLELAVSNQSALFPLPLLASILTSPDSAYQYVGAESVSGASCQHIRAWNTFTSQPALQYLSPFTVRDIWIDSSTNLPVKIAYSLRAGTGAVPTTSVEVFYSSYKLVNGVQFPFHISKSLNGTPWIDITVSSVSFNTGLADSSFSLR